MSAVRRNAVINVAGNLLPMVAAVAAMPVLLAGLGAARMGIFTLALGLFGFAGLFDLGLGRALTRWIAHHSQRGASRASMAPMLRTALLAVLAMGACWALLLWASADWLVSHVPGMNPVLRQETHAGALVLAWVIPVALLSTSLAGTLEGFQQFGRCNAIRAPLGAATFLVPAIVAQWIPTVDAVIAALGCVRLAGLLALLHAVAGQVPLLSPRGGDPLPLGPMWRYTGWLTVSNIVGPLMVHGDRYYLATILPPASVGYYTVPLDTMLRATAVPGAAFNAAFPVLTEARSRPANARSFIGGADAFLLFTWIVPLVMFGMLLPDAMTLWLGSNYATEVMEVSRLILAGVLLNGFALVPFTLLQAIGRTDITAKLHVIELPLFVVALATLVPALGVIGAAIAWSLRIAFDTLCLFVVAARLFPAASPEMLRLAASAAVGSLAILGAALLDDPLHRVLAAVSVMLLGAVLLLQRGGIPWLLSMFGSNR